MRLLAAVLALLPLCGCVYALQPLPIQRPIKIRLENPGTVGWIRVSGMQPREYSVPPDGRLELEYPAGLANRCDVYFLGVIRVKSAGVPKNIRPVTIEVGGREHRFQLGELYRMPVDAEGFHVVKF